MVGAIGTKNVNNRCFWWKLWYFISTKLCNECTKGAYADLTDLAPKYAKEAYDQLPDNYIKGNTINGKLYAFPILGNSYGQQVLTFNKEYVDKYNLDISKVDGSYESATEVLKEFHKKNQILLLLLSAKHSLQQVIMTSLLVTNIHLQ